MTYAPLDDHFDDHPKFVDFRLSEMGLMACAITYATRNLTDGVIPRSWPAKRFGREGAATAGRLVNERRVWAILPSGDYEIVGFLEHNPSRSEVLKKKAERVEAGRKGGRRSAEARGTGTRSSATTLLEAPAQAPASTKAKQEDEAAEPTALHFTGSSPGSRDHSVSPEPEIDPGRSGSTEAPSTVRLAVARRVDNATADRCDGYAVSAWAEGLRRATGRPIQPPRGGELERVVDVLLAFCPEDAAREEWAGARAFEFAQAAERERQPTTALKFVDWVNNGFEFRGGRQRASSIPKQRPAGTWTPHKAVNASDVDDDGDPR